MDQAKSIRKVNIPYFLAMEIVMPLVFFALGVWLGVLTRLVWVTYIGFGLMIAWWVFAPSAVDKRSVKKMEAVLAEQGFTQNYVFNTSSQKLSIDVNKGLLCMLFYFNPFKTYILPASHIERVWVEDGNASTNLTKSTTYVRFCFTIEGRKFRFYTFRASHNYSARSSKVLEGLSKADVLTKALVDARDRANAAQGR